MRTTIDIPNAQRAQLLGLAARRGEKGFSKLVQEALDLYLAAQARRDEERQRAASVLGTLDDAAAERLEDSVREIRGRWRC